MQLLEIAADGNGFGQDRSVVQFKDWQPLQRVALRDFFRLVPHCPHVDRDQWHFNAFFSQKNAHAPRVRCLAAVIKLHGILLRILFKPKHAANESHQFVPEIMWRIVGGGSPVVRLAPFRRSIKLATPNAFARLLRHSFLCQECAI